MANIFYLCMVRNLGIGRLVTKDRIKVICEQEDHLVTHFKPYHRFANDLKSGYLNGEDIHIQYYACSGMIY